MQEMLGREKSARKGVGEAGQEVTWMGGSSLEVWEEEERRDLWRLLPLGNLKFVITRDEGPCGVEGLLGLMLPLSSTPLWSK